MTSDAGTDPPEERWVSLALWLAGRPRAITIAIVLHRTVDPISVTARGIPDTARK